LKKVLVRVRHGHENSVFLRHIVSEMQELLEHFNNIHWLSPKSAQALLGVCASQAVKKYRSTSYWAYLPKHLFC